MTDEELASFDRSANALCKLMNNAGMHEGTFALMRIAVMLLAAARNKEEDSKNELEGIRNGLN